MLTWPRLLLHSGKLSHSNRELYLCLHSDCHDKNRRSRLLLLVGVRQSFNKTTALCVNNIKYERPWCCLRYGNRCHAYLSESQLIYVQIIDMNMITFFVFLVAPSMLYLFLLYLSVNLLPYGLEYFNEDLVLP